MRSQYVLRRLAVGIVLLAPLASCGKSIYETVTPEDSKESLREKAILAMDRKDYTTARSSLEKLWKDDKSNELTQLYANAILGAAGFDLYEIVVNLLKQSDAASIKSANDLLSALANAISVDATDEQLNALSQTLDVLSQAENQQSQALEFQKCLTVGIYALPVLDGINVAIEDIQSTLDSLPTRLSVDPADSRTCTAQSSTIASVGQDLTNTITQVGAISARIAEVNEVIANCSLLANSTASSNINVLTTRIATVLDKADRGCSLPDTGRLGSRILPSCMTTFVNQTSSDATAADGVVAGCEIFINCSQGGCF